MFKIQFALSAVISLAVSALLLGINLKSAMANEALALTRKLLLENKVELTGKSVNAKVIKVKFPPAAKTPNHTHEGPGPRYVIKGKLKVIEGDKVNTFSAGDVFWESGALMSVENVGAGEAELIIFELAPAQ